MQKLPERVRLVLFDWDGTLADSVPLVTEATNAALERHGLPPVSVAEIHDGMRFPTIPRIQRHIGERATDEVAHAVAASFHELVMELGPAHISLFPGVYRMLAELNEVHLPMGIVTNNNGEAVRSLIRHLTLENALPFIVGEDEVPHPKPDPTGIVQGCKHFGVPTAHTIYVGDSLTDEQAATRAGASPVGVAWPSESIVHAANNPYTLIFATPEAFGRAVLERV